MEWDAGIRFMRLVFLALVPYLLASQGTMLGGRTGVFNVAQEGIMLAGASLGFVVAWKSQSLVAGILAAGLLGGVFGLALAYFTTTLKLDQFVVGLALFFLGLGISTLAFKLTVGVTLQPPLIPTLSPVAVPGLSRIPLLGPVLFEQNGLVYTAILLSLLLWYVLYYTAYGLELRSVGENPRAADSLGVPVVRYRYLATVLGAVCMGVAGAYLPMVYTGTFTEGIVQGRGWLSIALTFFGGWHPLGILFGAFFFAVVEVLALRVQIVGGLIPYQFLLTLPYLATILVMVIAFRRAVTPAFLGQNYDREKRSLS